MDGMDYFILDVVEMLVGVDKWYIEEIICLLNGYVCYDFFDYVIELVFLFVFKNGYIIFGSFNNFIKV